MKYGCIGERLGHSFSKEIHNALADYDYELMEIARDSLSDFASKADFTAINVTIPYKEEIMPFMYEIDEHAKKIGAVNTVVNRSGKLYGYNTDFYGMRSLLRHAGIEAYGKKAAILGTGGTAKTAYAVLKAEGAKEVIFVSHSGKSGAVSYEELYENHTDTEIMINTAPVGMFPKIFEIPVDISRFPALSGVADAIYNPLRTPLVLQAQERNIAAEGGLYMLVAQGVRASEIFLDKKYPNGTVEALYEKLLSSKQSIVLSGMPGSGKSTVGRLLAELLSRKFIDTDEEIERKAKMPITEIFKKFGQEEFRRLESDIINSVSSVNGAVIATGGGSILKPENVTALKENGKIYFLDRPLNLLIPTDDRPLANDAEAIKKRYEERYSIYLATKDKHITADADAVTVAKIIAEDFLK